MNRILLLAAVCLVQITCLTKVRAASQDDAFPRIIFGTRISSKDSPIVQVRESSGNQSSLCTGTLITPSVVLTAWHCVSPRASLMSVVINGKRLKVKKVIIHPLAKMDEDNGILYNDIALLRLSQRVSIAPLRIVKSRPVQVGDAISILGFGLTEDGTAGSLYRGFTQVDGVTEAFLMTIFQFEESNSCSGDSGGPAIISFRSADGRTRSGLVGITSTGTNSRCTLGDRTNYINLQTPTVTDFILRNAPKTKLN